MNKESNVYKRLTDEELMQLSAFQRAHHQIEWEKENDIKMDYITMRTMPSAFVDCPYERYKRAYWKAVNNAKRIDEASAKTTSFNRAKPTELRGFVVPSWHPVYLVKRLDQSVEHKLNDGVIPMSATVAVERGALEIAKIAEEALRQIVWYISGDTVPQVVAGEALSKIAKLKEF